MRFVMIPAYYQGQEASVMDPAQLNGAAQGAAEIIRASTYGRMAVSFAVAPPYAIPLPVPRTGPCRNDWQAAAGAAASRAGATGTHLVFIAGDPTCGAGAHAARYSSSAFINSLADRQSIAHELFHCLGLGHAHRVSCGLNVAVSTCTAGEYGGAYSTQGGGTGPLAANEVASFGLSPPVIPVLSRLPTQTITLAPMETTPIFAVIKTADGNLTYFIEFHRGPWLGNQTPEAVVVRVTFSEMSSFPALGRVDVFEDTVGGVRVRNLGGGQIGIDTWTPAPQVIPTPAATPTDTHGTLDPNCWFTLCGQTPVPTPVRDCRHPSNIFEIPCTASPTPTSTATPTPDLKPPRTITFVPPIRVPTETPTAEPPPTPTETPTAEPTPTLTPAPPRPTPTSRPITSSGCRSKTSGRYAVLPAESFALFALVLLRNRRRRP